jgi:hypothetical protein
MPFVASPPMVFPKVCLCASLRPYEQPVALFLELSAETKP